ncbi:173_t:CDS:2, partial [Ambispora leptoticha]
IASVARKAMKPHTTSDSPRVSNANGAATKAQEIVISETDTPNGTDTKESPQGDEDFVVAVVLLVVFCVSIEQSWTS